MHSVLAVGFVPRVGASPAWRYSAHARDACLLEFELMLGQVLYEDGRSVFALSLDRQDEGCTVLQAVHC